MTFDTMSDEDIIKLIRSVEPGIAGGTGVQENSSAVEVLLERYKNLVRKKARTLFLIGGDNDDLMQEGMIGLYKAVREYVPERESSFYHFADLCITSQLYNAIKASNRQKNTPLNSYISLDAPVSGDFSEDDNIPTLADTLHPGNDQNPEQILIDKENVGILESSLNERLSPLEQDVLSYYINGYNYQQISEILDRSAKSIDNALQRIKAKLQAVIDKRG